MALCFQRSDLVADVLKAGEHAADLHTVIFGDGVDHIGGNDGGNRHRILGQGTQFLLAAADVIQQQNAHFVAAHQHIVPVLVHGDAHTVAIRVGGQQQVRLHGLAQFNALFQRLANFRVRVGAGGKIAVRFGLLRHHGHFAHTNALENTQAALLAAAVEGRIHHTDVARRAAQHAFGINGVDERIHHVLPDVFNVTGRHTGFKIRGLDVRKNIQLIDLFQHAVGHFAGDLAAVAAIHLIAVILGGVMAGGDGDARIAAQMPHRKGKGRRGHQFGVHIHLDAVGGQHGGGLLGEFQALVAAVPGNGHTGTVPAGAVQVVGKALGGLAHGVHVHAVGAGAQHAPQAGGTKGQVLVKTVVDLFVFPLNGEKFLGQVLVVQFLGKPAFIFCHLFVPLFKFSRSGSLSYIIANFHNMSTVPTI